MSKNMLVLELPEGTDGEEFVASLNDDEMFLIADWFGQELKNSIGEDMYEEIWERSIANALRGIELLREGTIKLDD